VGAIGGTATAAGHSAAAAGAGSRAASSAVGAGSGGAAAGAAAGGTSLPRRPFTAEPPPLLGVFLRSARFDVSRFEVSIVLYYAPIGAASGAALEGGAGAGAAAGGAAAGGAATWGSAAGGAGVPNGGPATPSSGVPYCLLRFQMSRTPPDSPERLAIELCAWG
jgi:hypothetical protein